MKESQELTRYKIVRNQEYIPNLYSLPLISPLLEIREGVELPLDECPFSEKFLQVIWNERHLSPELHAEDGSELKVISPGTWNVSAGPDFMSGAILVDGELRTGDVEIHRRSSDWNKHGHDSDPLYNSVILHAVWIDDAPPVKEGIKTFVLARHLNSGWCSLLWELEDACYPYARKVPLGDCALRWAMASDQRVMELLGAAGLSRFSAKAAHIMRLAADRGSDQALYELIFEALGYKNNRQQFKSLSQNVPLLRLLELDDDNMRLAMLLGCAGLIPDITRDTVLEEWQQTVSECWDRWWSIGVHPDIQISWNLAGTRPFNSPFRRLMAGFEMLQVMGFRPANWILEAAKLSQEPKMLLKRFESLIRHDSSWRKYRDFCHTIKPAADLIGHPRLLDMLANVFLPFLAGTTQDDLKISDMAQEIYLTLPLAQDNRLFKEAVQRFLMPPSRTTDLIKSACHQQGLLDIYKNFCLALDNNCQFCPFSTKHEGNPN